MNWWGRRAGLLLLLLVVLFSCEEDVSTIGIKRPNPKFRVNYAEIEIPSSVIQFEKLRSYNQGADADGVQRFLVGQYQDNEFGTVRAEIYTQISPPISYRKISAGAVMDSLVLELQTDFYYYGASHSPSELTIQIHELSDTINTVPHYNISKIPYEPEVLAEMVLTVDPTEFDESIALNNDNITTNNKVKKYSVPLIGDFATELFNTVVTDSATTYDFTKFTGKHKGFAFIPTVSDKILGLNPKMDDATSAVTTNLALYFTENGTQYRMTFVLYPTGPYGTLGFSSIESDRSGTVLQSIEAHKDFFPIDGKRYLQSGMGVLTKLDFTHYFEYMDTVKNAILNSAELVFENEPSDFPPPAQFQFRVLDDNNKYATYLQDTIVDGNVYQITHVHELQAAYGFSVLPNADGTVDLLSDAGALLTTSANAGNTMSAFVTTFFQDQYLQRNNEKRIKYCSLHPRETQWRKSVNRFIMNDNIKLKIYYTTPVVETLE